MGSTGKSNKYHLPPIKINPDWAYQPDDDTDLSDVVKNPIPFVGDGEDWRLGNIIENETIQPEYYDDFEIEIDKVKTFQPFVLQSGIINYQSWDDSDKPYVVLFEGQYYLLDGNHRMARAKLDGKKTMHVILSVRQRRK